jgi:hypothetical protein
VYNNHNIITVYITVNVSSKLRGIYNLIIHNYF